MDVKTRWNSTLESLVHLYWLRELTREWLKNPKYGDYWPLFTTQNEWTIVKYLMEVLQRFWYWTLWMSKRHTFTLHHVITVYNDMFDHMDGVMRALAKKKTQWKQDIYVVVKFAWQKLSENYTEATPTTGMVLISAHIIDSFQMLRSCRKWDKGMDIDPEVETSYTTEYQEAFPKYVENKSCAKHGRLPVTKSKSRQNNNLVSSAMASRSAPSSYNPYDLSSNDEEYLMHNDVAEMTPGWSHCAARLLTASRLYLNSPAEIP